ncbi:MAG: DUF1499 domain-containing protein [Spirochaetota bacterium]
MLVMILFSILGLFVVFILVRFVMLGKESQTGNIPGLKSGKLRISPKTPNCANSEHADDAKHYIEPLKYTIAEPEKAWAQVVPIIEKMGGVIQVQEENYVAATFQSGLFSFVDDFECRHEPGSQLIHFRSASRVGKSDLGANRKRILEFKNQFAAVS